MGRLIVEGEKNNYEPIEGISATVALKTLANIMNDGEKIKFFSYQTTAGLIIGGIRRWEH